MRVPRSIPPILLAAGAAEAAVRILSPHAKPPVRIPYARDYFTSEEIARGKQFARPQLALGMTRSAVEAAALAAVVSRTRSRKPRSALTPRMNARTAGAPPLIAGAAVAAATSLAVSLPPLPVSAIARRRAVSVGLITQSWRGWLEDLSKGMAIQSLFAAATGAGTVAAMRRWPHHWWAPAAAGSVFFGAALTALAPVLLDPIFNEFTPLPDGQARDDVLDLAEQAGVKIGEVYEVDASRRTTAANAYVNGLGPTKRVVLFDTLLDRYSRDELRLVVAHELGHVKHRDVPRGIAYAAIVSAPAALAIAKLSRDIDPDAVGTVAALPSLALAAGLVGAPIGLLGNRLSRAVERRADAFSLDLAGAPEAFVEFERRIALQNIADLEPPRLVTSLLASHPPTLERIAAADARL